MRIGGAMLGLVFATAGFIVSRVAFTEGVMALMRVLFAFAGLGAGTLIPFQFTLQQRTSETVTGRAFGTVSSLASTATLIGPLLGGSLVTAFGPKSAFIVSGSLTFLVRYVQYPIMPYAVVLAVATAVLSPLLVRVYGMSRAAMGGSERG